MDKIEINRVPPSIRIDPVRTNIVLHIAGLTLVSREYPAVSSARRAANRLKTHLQVRVAKDIDYPVVIVDNTRKQR